ncbi:MAG: hypothetical protein IKF41_02265 [Alphaproteobacteria bacterium]|nr:hypothetical protein [Alphaproteobacteria bacterium]
MTDKKIFPGAMNAEQRAAFARQQAEQQRAAENAKKLAAEKAEAIRIAKKMRKEAEQRRKDLINKFASSSIRASNVFKMLGALVVINFVIGAADEELWDWTTDREGHELYVGPGYRNSIREAYDPYFHGVPDSFGSSYHDSTINDRFKRHMCVLGIEALVLACVVIGALRERRAVVKDVDIMLKIEKVSQSSKVGAKLIKKMMTVAPEIVSHMSSESSVYFELLMDGSFDCDKNPQVFAFAKSVLAGHLHSHPEDMKRVLEVFDEASLPQSLVAKYKQNVR